jgi:hypothetical protein
MSALGRKSDKIPGFRIADLIAVNSPTADPFDAFDLSETLWRSSMSL